MATTDNYGNVIGSGSDTIVLTMSGDQAVGANPRFTLNVDGQQIGGEQSVSASKSAGQDQTFAFQGNFGTGTHSIAVTFTNNFLMPGESGDRNVYVDGITYNGQTVSNTTTPIYESPLYAPNSFQGTNGNAVFSVNDTTPVPAGASSNPTTTPGATTIGSGSDTLVLSMAEDAYRGDAQFTVAVDGKQIGGAQTVTASVAQGQRQEFDVKGDFGGGNHTVTVNYLNDQIGDFYAGTNLAIDTTDRNLYVMGASLNGGPNAGNTPWEMDSTGSRDFYVTAGSGAPASSSSSNNSSYSGTTTTDNTSTTGDTAAITSSNLGTGGMSFVTDGSDTTAASTNMDSGNGSKDGSSMTDPAAIAAVANDAGSGSTDWTPHVASRWSDYSGNHAGGGGGGWWHHQHTSDSNGAYTQQS